MHGAETVCALSSHHGKTLAYFITCLSLFLSSCAFPVEAVICRRLVGPSAQGACCGRWYGPDPPPAGTWIASRCPPCPVIHWIPRSVQGSRAMAKSSSPFRLSRCWVSRQVSSYFGRRKSRWQAFVFFPIGANAEAPPLESYTVFTSVWLPRNRPTTTPRRRSPCGLRYRELRPQRGERSIKEKLLLRLLLPSHQTQHHQFSASFSLCPLIFSFSLHLSSLLPKGYD